MFKHTKRLAGSVSGAVLAGAMLGAVVLPAGAAAAQAAAIAYQSQFGSQGSGPGQFGAPVGVAVNTSTGDVYVTDAVNDVVEEFDYSGNYLSEFGSPGSGNGQFNTPTSIAVNPNTGDIYVFDSNNARIEEFDSSGNYLTSWPAPSAATSQPDSVAVDPITGDVYVTSYNSNQVDEYDSSGNFLLTWGWGVADLADQLETCTSSCNGGLLGDGNGQFNGPTAIAINPVTGDVYVADSQNNRVEEFDSSGDYLTQFGSLGSGDGQFGNNSQEIYCPSGLAVDPGTGDVYAVDEGNNRVEQFDSSGDFQQAFGWGVTDGAAQFETCTSACMAGISGGGNGQFNFPDGDFFDPATGSLYVVDTGNYRIEEFGSASATQTAQVITFTSTPPASAVVGGTYLVSATGGGSGNPVTFTIDASSTSVCSISAATVTFNHTGSCVIHASQAGNADYLPAQAQQTIAVGQAAPALKWAPAAITFGTPLTSTQLDAGASVPGTFTYNPPAGTVLQPGTYTLTATFTPADTTDYSGGKVSTQLTVGFTAPCITKTIHELIFEIHPGQSICISSGGIAALVAIDRGGALWVNGGSILSLTSNEGLALTLCGARAGVVHVTDTTGPVLIGGTNCAGNTIFGSVKITGSTGGVSFVGNTVKGALTITGNSGGLQYSGNTVTGTVTVSGNS